MDWGLDDILMSDFQIPHSPTNSITQEGLSDSNDNKDDAIFPKDPGLDVPMPTNQNTQLSPLGSTPMSKPSLSSGPLSNVENESPDYVSELHQLLSEQDGEVENTMRVSNTTSRKDSRTTTIDKNETSFSMILMDNRGAGIENVKPFGNGASRIDSPVLPLLLSPPPAYKDDVSELSFTVSPSVSDAVSADMSTENSIHPAMRGPKFQLPSRMSGPSHNYNTTISVGDTFLTISPATVATVPLTSNQNVRSDTSQTMFQSLPFSITRLPVPSTTINPAKYSSNSFSFLPITPMTSPCMLSTATSTTNSPLLLQALAPRTTVNSASFVQPSPLSRCSITPILPNVLSDTESESVIDIKRLKSQPSLIFATESAWKRKVEFRGATKDERKENRVFSAPSSVESQSLIPISSEKPLNFSLPTFPLRENINISSNGTLYSSNTDSMIPLISLPPAYVHTENNQLLTNVDPERKSTDDNDKEEKDQNFEAASKLAHSLEALQNSAMPQPGESSADLMNALSLSILPIQDDLSNRQLQPGISEFQTFDSSALIEQSSPITYGPTVFSSDLSLTSDTNFMGKQHSSTTINSNPISTKCPLSILSADNGTGSTISIRPIWKEKSPVSIGSTINKSAWDSAVVAQLGTLKPCAPPPSALRINIKPFTSQNLPLPAILTSPQLANTSVGASVSACEPNISQFSVALVTPVLSTNLESTTLQNEDGPCNFPCSPPQPLGITSAILPPPPYSCASLSFNNILTSGKSAFSPSQHTSKMPASISEVDSGVESIDSLSPKDISPISSPSTSTVTTSESLSHCIIPPPPPASFNSCTNNTIMVANNNGVIKDINSGGATSKEEKIAYHNVPDNEKEEKELSTEQDKISCLRTSLNMQNIMDNLKRNLESTSTVSAKPSKSVLSTLLSTVPKPTKSSELLSTLLSSQSSSLSCSPAISCISSLPAGSSLKSLPLLPSPFLEAGMVQSINPTFLKQRAPLKRSLSSVIAINPNDMILSKEEKCKAKMREFFRSTTTIDEEIPIELENMIFPEFHHNGVDDSNNSLVDQPILRSALEDMDTSSSSCQQQRQNHQRYDVLSFPIMARKDLDLSGHVVQQSLNNNKSNNIGLQLNPQDSLQAPKHDAFDCMIEQGQKLVSSWDTDLHLRLKQLDSELGQAKQDNSNCVLTIKEDTGSQWHGNNDPNGVTNKPPKWNLVQRNPNNTTSTNNISADNTKLPNASVNKSSINTPSVRTLLCQYCTEEFESNVARNAHKRKVHSRRHLCVPCDMVFASSTKLERHLLTHKGTKDHKCQICGKAFMIERNLILHQKLHSGQRDYVCDICGKSYFTKSGLQAHQKQNHSPPNESNCGDEAYVKGSGFVCKDKKCEKRHFATRYDLEQHRNHDHKNDTQEETLKCVNCDATFKSSTQLKRHTANAHCSRPFKCPHCPHRSKNKTNLERHVAFHTSNKDAFQCLHCGRKFAFKNSMKKHLEKGRCNVLKELEKAQKGNETKNGNDKFKSFLEATIMRHLQQTPKSPALPQTPQIPAPTVSLQPTTLSSIFSQPQVDTNTNLFSIIQGNNGNDMITSMDISPSPCFGSQLNFKTAHPSNFLSTSSSSISSYNNTATSICSDRNLQSSPHVMPVIVMPGGRNNENNVPNDILYQFDTTTSCNSINN